MANVSSTLANALLAHSVGKTSYTMPVTYLALSSTSVTLSAGVFSGFTEVTGGAYARQDIHTTSPFGTPSSESITTSANIVFPTATAGYTVTAIAIYDASTGGNILWGGNLTTPKTLTTGDTFEITSGNLTLSLS